ncbi:hypothetical protein MTsPCn5_27100 [Croceitalea sp. MTPC5]|nr:hypothetical protein MTsPCn5_27100 [Croceitalea sp. MTPC5]
MSFTTGQLVFAILFIVGFVATMVILYKKDRNLHAKNYSGVKWVLFSFIIFIVFLFLIKHFLKN